MQDDLNRVDSEAMTRLRSVAVGAAASATVGILFWEVLLKKLVVSSSLWSGSPIEVLAWLGGALGTAHIFMLGYCLIRIGVNRIISFTQSR